MVDKSEVERFHRRASGAGARVKCRFHRCQTLPSQTCARQGRELSNLCGTAALQRTPTAAQYSLGNVTLVLERSCSVMIHTRPSGDSGTS